MIDIHNHILYGIDDGSSSIEESIEMVKRAYKMGYTHLIFTPHFIEGTPYNCNNRSKKIRLSVLQKKIKEIDIPIYLFVGNEVHIHDHILENLQKKQIMTLNGSRYLLLELPFNNRYQGLEDVIFDLTRNDIIPIIAHVERYRYISEKEAKRLIDLGCLLQGNALSLSGDYGKDAKKRLKEFLKLRMIHFIASDAHNEKTLKELKGIEKTVKKIVRSDLMVKDLLYNNAKKIIKDEDIIRYNVK